MLASVIAVLVGLAVLVWSADRFVDGAVGVAKFCGISTLMIGMVVVGFGTSAPEMVVSAISAMQDNPELALGNAFGSNIANIALILGFTAVVSPVAVKRVSVLRDLPILMAVTAFAVFQIFDLSVTRLNGILLLAVFAVAMSINVISEKRMHSATETVEQEEKPLSLGKAIFWLLLGLLLLVASSRLLVWGAINIAQALGVSDLLIGLTIVAVGTSLPELASSIAAARRGENDLAFGNIVGSNLFNTLLVVGIAAVIKPMESISSAILVRDIPVMAALTLLLFIFGLPLRKNKQGRTGRINRFEGLFFVLVYVSYLTYLVLQATGKI
jgi:cation:H+ antiporter